MINVVFVTIKICVFNTSFFFKSRENKVFSGWYMIKVRLKETSLSIKCQAFVGLLPCTCKESPNRCNSKVLWGVRRRQIQRLTKTHSPAHCSKTWLREAWTLTWWGPCTICVCPQVHTCVARNCYEWRDGDFSHIFSFCFFSCLLPVRVLCLSAAHSNFPGMRVLLGYVHRTREWQELCDSCLRPKYNSHCTQAL